MIPLPQLFSCVGHHLDAVFKLFISRRRAYSPNKHFDLVLTPAGPKQRSRNREGQVVASPDRPVPSEKRGSGELGNSMTKDIPVYESGFVVPFPEKRFAFRMRRWWDDRLATSAPQLEERASSGVFEPEHLGRDRIADIPSMGRRSACSAVDTVRRGENMVGGADSLTAVEIYVDEPT